jgi:hypothetical protein
MSSASNILRIPSTVKYVGSASNIGVNHLLLCHNAGTAGKWICQNDIAPNFSMYFDAKVPNWDLNSFKVGFHSELQSFYVKAPTHDHVQLLDKNGTPLQEFDLHQSYMLSNNVYNSWRFINNGSNLITNINGYAYPFKIPNWKMARSFWRNGTYSFEASNAVSVVGSNAVRRLYMQSHTTISDPVICKNSFTSPTVNCAKIGTTEVASRIVDSAVVFSKELFSSNLWVSGTSKLATLQTSNVECSNLKILPYNANVSYDSNMNSLDITSAKGTLMPSVPPFNMTSASQTVSGQSYFVTVSSQTDQFQQSFFAFDNNANSKWQSSSPRYHAITGVYTGTNTTTVSGASVAGEWIQLKMPMGLVVSSYTISSVTKCLASWLLAGSIDGVTWFRIDERSGIAATVWNNTAQNTYSVDNQPPMATHLRLILRATTGSAGPNGDMFTLTELRFAGAIDGGTNRNVRVLDNLICASNLYAPRITCSNFLMSNAISLSNVSCSNLLVSGGTIDGGANKNITILNNLFCASNLFAPRITCSNFLMSNAISLSNVSCSNLTVSGGTIDGGANKNITILNNLFCASNLFAPRITCSNFLMSNAVALSNVSCSNLTVSGTLTAPSINATLTGSVAAGWTGLKWTGDGDVLSRNLGVWGVGDRYGMAMSGTGNMRIFCSGSYPNGSVSLSKATNDDLSSAGASFDDMLTCLPNGNVGVGDPLPSFKLAVNGQARIGTNLGVGTDPVSTYSIKSSGNCLLNNSVIGQMGWTSTWAGFSHSSREGQSTYALLQSSAKSISSPQGPQDCNTNHRDGLFRLRKISFAQNFVETFTTSQFCRGI